MKTALVWAFCLSLLMVVLTLTAEATTWPEATLSLPGLELVALNSVASYITTVTVVNNEGRPVKAEVFCGGTSQGFTNPDTGEISFSMKTNEEYSVSAKRMGESASSKIRGGGNIVLRLK
ncbi:MAG: hypothetical protein LBT38_08915 [Deltaproteobacteria bacterium]|jgi:hypothetical protein|nr:hypothetical protein [Deltaproteobacteria bacterium]